MAAPPPRPTRPGKKEIQVVRALYDYTAQHSDELSFTEGTVLYVINKDDPSWWKCRANDKEGLVPSNYVGENTAEIENPLHEAAKRGNISFVTELLQAGVSVNGLDKAGNTALHWACRGGHAKVVELLLTKKPTVNAQNKMGDTPLHLAAWGGGPDVMGLLLAQDGIKVGIKNGEGKTASQLCRNDQAAAILLQFSGEGSSLAGDADYEDDD